MNNNLWSSAIGFVGIIIGAAVTIVINVINNSFERKRLILYEN